MDDLDKDNAQANPASVFDKPADVVVAKELTSKEKSKVLQEWELDARLLEVATEEGLNKKAKPSVLPEVKEAQRKLGAKPIAGDGSPTKFRPRAAYAARRKPSPRARSIRPRRVKRAAGA